MMLFRPEAVSGLNVETEVDGNFKVGEDVVTRLVHLDVEGTSEELLRQLSYAIKNQLVASKAPYSGLWNAKYP